MDRTFLLRAAAVVVALGSIAVALTMGEACHVVGHVPAASGSGYLGSFGPTPGSPITSCSSQLALRIGIAVVGIVVGLVLAALASRPSPQTV